MEITQVLILLLHPIAALVVIREFVRQRNWRKLSISLKGSERAAELDNHEIQGERLFRWVLIVIALAFVAKVTSAIISGEDFAADVLMPGHFHGWGGITRASADDLPLDFRKKDKRQEKSRGIIRENQRITRPT